jgi:D-alanyl-D-alanine dipeptidase
MQKELNEQGLGLKIWDAYRPHKVQFLMWDIVKDKFENPEMYVGDPHKGSRHNRGCAIDCTLIDLKTGEELEMPSAFDKFSEIAHADYQGCSETAKKNRALLTSVAEKYGFKQLPSEWWHFALQGWNQKDESGKEKYPILDISFEELAAQK